MKAVEVKMCNLMIKITARNALLIVLGALIMILSISVPSANAQTLQICPTVRKTDIIHLFDRWNQSLQTGNPDAVVQNYARDAILLPTVSNQVRHNYEEIRDYFVKFLGLQPEGKIEEQNIRIFCDVAIDSGIYSFTLRNFQPVAMVQARYTFVYQRIGNQWLIVAHHSSGMPEINP